MVVSPAMQRIYASAPDGPEIWETLELAHPAFLTTHYITNAPLPFTALLETAVSANFITLPFSATQPGSSAGGQQDLGLVIDNVDREIIEELERAATQPDSRIAVTWRAYTSDDLTAPGSGPIQLSITEVSAGLSTVEATAGRTDVLNKKFPAILYSTQQFPGLDR